ncbi:Nup188p ASCRUDRAFT_30320 [Ascoidea rubescens DSM 1968]|uniref:Uncharacterized protein n=1 Tax=Ascoidea rubescens DSM 1968 TaxID=1344418 RepID=A0A1D2VPQ4_9ASCO|nr:hypothetical protein ASCRUDRAFT_30320 [Ascoidea rubescens DSM 1968]ODV63603.1 hypothetical protein ASCRUDRAFT_30320 [Ascoidea rubescens DSM 1968]
MILNDNILTIEYLTELISLLFLGLNTNLSSSFAENNINGFNNNIINNRSFVENGTESEIETENDNDSYSSLNTDTDTTNNNNKFFVNIEEILYFNDPQTFKLINDIITLNQSFNNPMVLYFWILILQLKYLKIETATTDNDNQLISDDQSFLSSLVKLDDFNQIQTLDQDQFQLSHLKLNYLKNLISFLIQKFDQLNGFDQIEKNFNHLKFNNLYVIIQSCFLISILPYLILENFFDNFFTKKLILLLKFKLPNVEDSLLSFLNLCLINGNFALENISNLSTYFYKFKPDQTNVDYELENQDDDNGLIILKDNLFVSPPFELDNENFLIKMKPGTKGKILTNLNIENWEFIVFYHGYNGWNLLGRFFQNILVKLIYNQPSDDNPNISDSISVDEQEFLITFIKLLRNTFNILSGDQCLDLIDSLSVYLNKQTLKCDNIMDLVLRLFNYSLQKKNMDYLVVLTGLFDVFVKKIPDTIWSFLIKSNLLNLNKLIFSGSLSFSFDDETNTNNEDGDLLLNILNSVETHTQNFDFSISLVKLFDSLIDDCLLIQETDQSVFSDKVKSEILLKFTQYFLFLFENFQNYGFSQIHQSYNLSSLILDVFQRILLSTYSINLQKNSKPQLPIHNLTDSAERIIKSFLVVNFSDRRAINPIVKMISLVDSELNDFTITNIFQVNDINSFHFKSYILSCFEFSRLILSIRGLFFKKISYFEKELYKSVSSLINIYSKILELRVPILKLLIKLISYNTLNKDLDSGKDKDSEKLPSLLAYLGEYHTKVLLYSIANDLQNSLDNYEIKNYLYDFISTVLEYNQEGLSIMFLAGHDVRLHDKSNNTNKKKQELSIFQILKNDALNINNYPHSVSIHLLESISYAYNSWTFAQKITPTDKALVEILVKTFLKFKDVKISEFTGNKEMIKYCYKNKLISIIGEISAFLLFFVTNSSSKEKVQLQTIIKPIVDLLESDSFINTYSKDLFKINFRNSIRDIIVDKKSILSKVDFSEFMYSTLIHSRKRYGIHSTYNLILLDQVFCDCDDWDSVRQDLIDNSIQSQYVESQATVVKSWGALITSNIKYKKNQTNLKFIDVAKSLIEINNKEGIVPGFEEVYLERIELVFFIMYNISQSKNDKITEVQLKSLIIGLIISLMSKEIDFFNNFTNNNFQFYRSLLRALSITLNISKNLKYYYLDSISEELLKFFNLYIAKGTKLIILSIQEKVVKINELKKENADKNESDLVFELGMIYNRIEDLLLFISIFKEIGSLKPSFNLLTSITNCFTVHQTLRSVLDLYYYSNSMKINNEPVFADLALRFIFELVSADVVSEQLVSNDLFSTLIESPISLIIQKGIITPDILPRYHHVWSNGLLSVILILLKKFGERLFPEICLFLKRFSAQIYRTITGWSLDLLVITFPSIYETGQLILIFQVLHSLNFEEFATNSSIDILPGLNNKEDRDILVSNFNQLLSHPKFLASRFVPSSIEEQKMLEDTRSKSKLIGDVVNEIVNLRNNLCSIES